MSYTPLLATANGHTQLFFSLLVIFVAAKLLAEVFERLRQPAVVGEILAGVLIGPGVLGWVAPNQLTDLLAELGVIFLLFLVGLETKPAEIFRVGARAALVAVLGVIVPFIAGYAVYRWWGKPNIEAIFVGAALVATSVGIVVAQIGLSLAAVSESAYAVVLFMAVATTLIAPPFLRLLFKDEKRELDPDIVPVTPIA